MRVYIVDNYTYLIFSLAINPNKTPTNLLELLIKATPLTTTLFMWSILWISALVRSIPVCSVLWFSIVLCIYCIYTVAMETSIPKTHTLS